MGVFINLYQFGFFMSKLTLSASIALILSPSLSAFANATEPTVVLDEMVITATRTPTKINNALAQTTVINQQQLERYQGQSVLDVLKTQAGFSHYTNGGRGKTSNFYLRGYDSKSILVLIDGVRYSSLSTGIPALSLLPSDQIERIEIVHGASGSSIYGADAVGGVVQIFTKKGNTDGSRFSATLGAGSHDYLNYGATANLKNDTTYLTLSASHEKTDGFNAIIAPKLSTQADDDGFESRNISLAFGHQINDKLQLDSSVIYSKSFTDYDDVYLPNANESQIFSEQKNGSAQVSATWQYHNNGTLKAQYGQSVDRSQNFTGNTPTGNFDSRQQQLGLTAKHNLPTGTLIAGVENLKQKLNSSSSYTLNKKDTDSIFAGYQTNLDKLDGQIFVRHDDNSQYGNKTTYNAGLAYHITPSLRTGASYAKGFRSPTFNESYGPAFWGSNPDLKPESSHNYELFGEYNTPQGRTRLTAYQNKVENMIAWDAISNKNQNIDQAKIQGISLTSDWNISDYLFGLSYDYQKATNDGTGANAGKLLAIRPKNKGLIYAGYQHKQFDVRGEYQYVGNYYNDFSEQYPLKSYNLFNLSANYQLNPHIRLTGRINNVFDKNYITSNYGTTYGEDGRNFFGAVTVSY